MPYSQMTTDVSVDVLAGASVVTFAVKFSSPSFELNVYLPQSQLGLLRQASTIPWSNGAIQIGEAAGALAFWCAGEPGMVSIMVGRDDQTWDFSVQVPATTIDIVLREATKRAPFAGK